MVELSIKEIEILDKEQTLGGLLQEIKDIVKKGIETTGI